MKLPARCQGIAGGSPARAGLTCPRLLHHFQGWLTAASDRQSNSTISVTRVQRLRDTSAPAKRAALVVGLPDPRKKQLGDLPGGFGHAFSHGPVSNRAEFSTPAVLP